MKETKVIILCGGRGRRLKPLTTHTPKPLVVLNGKPVIQHIIEFYTRKNFNNFILCVGYRSEAIRKFISGYRTGAKIEFSDAGVSAGILKRLYAARDLIDKRAIVTYGDTFINIDIDDMMAFHQRRGGLLTATIADIRSPFGLVRTGKDKRMLSFDEKPLFQYYIGHMIFEKKALDMPDKRTIDLPDGEGLVKFFRLLCGKKKLYAYKHSGLQITFNTLYERHRAEEEMVKFFTEQEG